MLHLRAFGLTLLAHLVFVLGGSLILLKRLRNVLGCLVGQTVMVDCLLRLGFFGDRDTRVVERCLGLHLIFVELQINRCRLSLVVGHVRDDGNAAGGIFLCLFGREGILVPVAERLDASVLQQPCVLF